MKQAIVARSDLGMSPGKLAAQVAHASLAAVEQTDEQARREWKQGDQKKVVLKGPDERTLFERKEEAEAATLPTAVINDAGRTQLEPETVTALAVGPAGDDAVDAVTGDLSLF
jgi:PTH2 family peptidyl-tRNA hydrolase